MTATPTIARCPRCGNVDSIFVRDCDDLVCQSCREGAFESPISFAPPSRHVSGSGADTDAAKGLNGVVAGRKAALNTAENETASVKQLHGPILSYKAGMLLYDLFWERWKRERRA